MTENLNCGKMVVEYVLLLLLRLFFLLNHGISSSRTWDILFSKLDHPLNLT